MYLGWFKEPSSTNLPNLLPVMDKLQSKNHSLSWIPQGNKIPNTPYTQNTQAGPCSDPWLCDRLFPISSPTVQGVPLPQSGFELRNWVPAVLKDSQLQPRASCGTAEEERRPQLGAS